MAPGVLDGVVAIEAKAAKLVEEAKREARSLRDGVKAELGQEAQRLAREADTALAKHKENVEARKTVALAQLQQRSTAAKDVLEVAASTQVEPMAAEVARLLEQGGHGH